MSIHMISVDNEFKECPFGSIFIDPSTADVYDTRSVHIVHSGVDTVKQLYNGYLHQHVLALFEEPGIVDFAGQRWMAGRIGRDSGYQYKLQNADLGLILLIKSFHVQAENEGPHLKIEVSPHAILARHAHELQSLMDELAGNVLVKPEKRQCAVHLCVDVQGWTPPKDFDAHLHCRSRRVKQFNGINEIDFASTSAVYGRGETWLFGSPAGIQLAVYDKTLETRVSDRWDYWHSIWSQSANYDEEKPVYRVELRFHHTVIDQFSLGTVNKQTGEVAEFADFNELSHHLTGIWQYGFESFRYFARPGVFHPIWTILSRTAFISDGELYEYKRHYKSARGFSGKNVELALGNLISLAARQRLSGSQLWKMLQQLDVFDVILDHYHEKGMRTWQLSAHIKKLLEERYILWGKAI